MQTVMMRSPAGTTALPQRNFARCAVRTVPRRGLNVRNALIGDVNDPEKTREKTAKKEEKSSWAAPTNKNPLEKKQVGHGGEAAVDEAKDAAENAKKSVVETAKQAREAVEKLTKGGDDK